MASPVFIFIMSLLLSISNSALLLPLTHSLSQFNTNSSSNSSSTHHLLKSSSARSAARFHRHRHRHRQVSLPLSPGSDYTLSFSLASQTISLYMDTGSDVVWVPCHPFECILCDGEYSPSAIPLNITTTTTSPKPTNCKSPACSAVHSSLPSSDLCAIAHCPLESIEIDDECKNFHCPPFYYAYGDGSFVAKLYEDTLSIPMSLLKLPKFTFGCAHTSLGEPIGVAGFGRGPLSFPAQLSPDIGGNYFSYCLLSHSFHKSRLPPTPSPLILGRRRFKDTSKSVVYYSYTPMLNNPKHPYFYCVGLEAVSIGNRRIRAPQSLRSVDQRGNGGMVVDSGTTFTMLPRKFYNSVVNEFDARLVGSVYKRASRVEARIGLSPCYYYYYYYDEEEDNNNNNVLVPQLVLHFGGNSSIVMPRRNYFYNFFDGKRKVGCLMIMDGGDDGGGPAGLLGNYQQQGFEVVYDLEQNRIGFAKTKCASLWDTTLN